MVIGRFRVLRHLGEGRLAAVVVLNPLLDGIQHVVFTQLVQAEVLPAVHDSYNGVDPRRALRRFCNHLVAHFLHDTLELTLRSRGEDRPVNILAYSVAHGRLAVLLGQPFSIIGSAVGRVLYHGNLSFPAQPVGDRPHPSVIRRRVVELLSVHIGNGVYDKVIVIMPGVAVGSDHDLKAVAP